jgi:signal transduction histidine kinase
MKHGGNISLTPVADEGTTFDIDLPFKDVNAFPRSPTVN